MAINIPSKKAKQESQLRDGLRILAWQSYNIMSSGIGSVWWGSEKCCAIACVLGSDQRPPMKAGQTMN